RIIAKALEKDREARYQTASDLRVDIKRLRREGDSERMATVIAPSTPLNQMKALWGAASRPLIAFPIVITLAVAVGLGSWSFYHNTKVRWAREQAIPEITRLIKGDKYRAAVALAKRAEKYLPADPALNQLWSEMSRKCSITTSPPGADIYMKEYAV